MRGIRNMASYRTLITRVTLGYYFIFLLWRGYSHLLPVQLERPVLTRMNYDLSFWLYKLSGLNVLLVQNSVGAWTFTILVIAFCALAIVFPRQKIFSVPFSIFFLLLAITFNIYLCHSAHYLGGMIWISVAFWPRQDENFELLWDGMRYYACWIYATAFLWKVINGSFFQAEAGVLTFRSNLAGYLYQNPETFFSHAYYWFLQHPGLINAGHKIVALIEGVFLVGFFTKKYDVLLIFCALFIFISIYFFSDVFFAELLIIIFPLLPRGAWQWLHRRVDGERQARKINELMRN